MRRVQESCKDIGWDRAGSDASLLPVCGAESCLAFSVLFQNVAAATVVVAFLGGARPEGRNCRAGSRHRLVEPAIADRSRAEVHLAQQARLSFCTSPPPNVTSTDTAPRYSHRDVLANGMP